MTTDVTREKGSTSSKEKGAAIDGGRGKGGKGRDAGN